MNKLNSLIISVALFAALTGSAQETCQEGLKCVLTSNQIVLREVKIVQDHNLYSCQETTLKNFGSNMESCQLEIERLSTKPTPQPTACRPEAQIIAKVYQTDRPTIGSCLVQLTEIKQFNPNQLCRLEIEELVNWIEVGMKNGHDCAYDVSDEISGVLYKNSSGTLLLEH